MPGLASATGLISARVKPISRKKQKHVELTGSSKPAPFTLRPFAGLFNPYPYGCSVLCNHPADCEAKDVVRRAKDTWATEGKALLLPEEMEMIRASLTTGDTLLKDSARSRLNSEAHVPEELFRKYTETDSRPPTPAPTLASGPPLSSRQHHDDTPLTSNPRERTAIVLDLRTNSQIQDNDTFTWHALTLEPPPTPRKYEISACKPPPPPAHTSRPIVQQPLMEVTDAAIVEPPAPLDQSYDANANDVTSASDEQPVIIRRRGKRLRKRKCRRDSAYGQQTEVRDPPEPSETQVSQIGIGSRRPSDNPVVGETEDTPFFAVNEQLPVLTEKKFPDTFIEPEIVKHLCRELNVDRIEGEFSRKKKIALEEAMRVKNELEDDFSQNFDRTSQNDQPDEVPRVFTRQAARFEILDGHSLSGLTVLDYLGKYVYMPAGRKMLFNRAFRRYHETVGSTRILRPERIHDALNLVMGKPMTEKQLKQLIDLIDVITVPIEFRTWCGLCAVVERLVADLPARSLDPPDWLEAADFETLERRLKRYQIDLKLANLLREIRDR